MKLFTIGFTKKPASRFFELINQNNIKTLVDVRLNNVSQLSGFAKKNDLKFFLKEICQTDYIHAPDLAPENHMLKDYKNKIISWDAYASKFLDLMEKRNVEKLYDPECINESCLLCSEDKPHFCHRRLVAEYLDEHWNTNFAIKHLE